MNKLNKTEILTEFDYNNKCIKTIKYVKNSIDFNRTILLSLDK